MAIDPTVLRATFDLRSAILKQDADGMNAALAKGADPYMRVEPEPQRGFRSAFEEVFENAHLMRTIANDTAKGPALKEATQAVLAIAPVDRGGLEQGIAAYLGDEAHNKRTHYFLNELRNLANEQGKPFSEGFQSALIQERITAITRNFMVLSSAAHQTATQSLSHDELLDLKAHAMTAEQAGLQLGRKAAKDVFDQMALPESNPNNLVRWAMLAPINTPKASFDFQKGTDLPEPKSWLQRRRAWLEDKGLLPSERGVKDNWAP